MEARGDTERRWPCEDNTLTSSLRYDAHKIIPSSSCGDSRRHEFSSVVSYDPPPGKDATRRKPSQQGRLSHPSKPECILLTARAEMQIMRWCECSGVQRRIEHSSSEIREVIGPPGAPANAQGVPLAHHGAPEWDPLTFLFEVHGSSYVLRKVDIDCHLHRLVLGRPVAVAVW